MTHNFKNLNKTLLLDHLLSNPSKPKSHSLFFVFVIFFDVWLNTHIDCKQSYCHINNFRQYITHIHT